LLLDQLTELTCSAAAVSDLREVAIYVVGSQGAGLQFLVIAGTYVVLDATLNLIILEFGFCLRYRGNCQISSR